MKFSFYFNLLFFLYYVLSKFRQYCFYMSGFKNISMAAVQMKYLGEHFDYLFTYYTHNCRLWIWEQVLIIYNSLVWTVSLFLIIIILLGWWSYNQTFISDIKSINLNLRRNLPQPEIFLHGHLTTLTPPSDSLRNTNIFDPCG